MDHRHSPNEMAEIEEKLADWLLLLPTAGHTPLETQACLVLLVLVLTQAGLLHSVCQLHPPLDP